MQTSYPGMNPLGQSMKHPAPVIVALIAVGAAAALCFRAFSDPVPMERLKNLRKGMTQEEVRSVIGKRLASLSLRAYNGFRMLTLIDTLWA
jgi:hypothetical protein